jgi:hypothetical protein
MNRQIQTLVHLGKMKPNTSEYTCKVTLLIKNDNNSRRFYGDYRPLNMQTLRDAYPMPLIEDVLSQLAFARNGFLHLICKWIW